MNAPAPRKATKRPKPKGNPWREYERRKEAYEREHPYSTPAQWSAAMRRIAKELGV